jgi:hypothetical protein
MHELRMTLVPDGTTDDALMPILIWLLQQQGIKIPISPNFADLRRPRKSIKDSKLAAKVQYAITAYPCDLLFIHRDAETQPPQQRRDEIKKAVESLSSHENLPVYIGVIPVRMTEAWLLFDERALRIASDNPNGKMALKMPRLSELESLADPKNALNARLKLANGLNQRRSESFDLRGRSKRIADLIDDFSPLRMLPAFQALEHELERAISAQGWRDL